MGVHQSKEVYSKVKDLLGIPRDEPIFILRAQDKFSIDGIKRYREIAHDKTIIGEESEEWVENVGSKINDFINWQNLNRDKVKVPDVQQ